MLGRGTLPACGDAPYRPTPFKAAEQNVTQEHKVRRLFEEGLLKQQTPSEFDRVFGEDPLDFLMTEFALPIYDAEIHRSMIERRGKVERKIILTPEALTFEGMEAALQKQWTERTCTYS